MTVLRAQKRAPWWQWALVSLGSSLLMVALTVAGVVALLFRGVDLTDYIFLSHPPFLTDSVAAAVIAVLLVAQSVVPALAAGAFRPARALVLGRFARPADPAGLLLRLAAGAALVLGVQVLWTRFGPQSPEPLRMIDHLIYAVAGGGQFWPRFWLVAAIGLVGPVAEEVLYRGVAFGLCRRRWGFWLSALATAAVFGLSHGWQSALPTGVLGLYLAWQADRDGTLLGAVALHVLNNLGAVLVMSMVH